LEEEESPSSSEDEDDFLMDSTLPEASDFDSPSDDSGFDSSLPDMGDFDSPSSDMGENSGFDSPLPNTGDDFGFDSPMPDMGDDSGFDSPSSDTGDDFDFDSPSSDMGDDSGFDGSLPDMDFSEMGMGEQQEDPGFDTGAEDNLLSGFGDIGSDFASDSIELENEAEEPVSSFGNDDFALSGLDEILDKSKVPVLSEPEPKRGFFKRKKAAAVEEPEAEDIEEIRLSQQDVDSLLRTLASYPLNLRIVCEELIAEQVLLPQQLSKLIRLLVSGANVRETAEFAEKITGKPIVIPKSFEKMSGAAFEAEQSSFAYIFIHNFLPVLRLFAVITVLALSVFYLGYRFVYIPIKAENLYKRGYERISAGEYQRANQLFNEAFTTHRNKNWFYRYAEAFRDQRRFLLAEEKYDELLRHYPRDKKGVLDYARLNTYYLLNYEKANRLLQQQLLDFSPNDFEGLLAAGDNFLAWADSDPSRFFDRYEDARFSYARLLELNGWRVPIVERMLRYFIRTDNLREVIYLRAWFENDRRRRLSTPSLAELGGYLLDKQLERPSGVPNPFVESIESVRDMLLQAVREDPYLPEPHYHLARYHHNLSNVYEERLTLENAIRAFDLAQTETVRRRLNRVDAHFRYANLLVNNREFFPAEEQLIRGIQLYEDFLSRNLIRATPQLGQLYAAKGDLEYFVKSGDMRAALRDYRLAERYGYSPPEIQYRMGAAFYQLEDWRNALEYLFRASADLPLNRRLLYALGNVTYQRGDYFASQGYFNRLIDILEGQRIRLPVLLPNDNPQFLELGERLMMARNNAGVVYEALAEQTGNREYRSRALGLYAESARAWDSITRDPQTMVRMRLTDSPSAPGINLGFLNANNALRPTPNFSPQIFPRIDRDVLEPSRWEELAPFGGLQ
jgi:tetratricopeptide (TPR) repeat protein